MITRHLRVPFVAVTLLAASLGGALATSSGTSGTTGGSTTGGGATTVTTTGTTGSPTSGTVTSVPAHRDDRTDWAGSACSASRGLGAF